MATFLMALFIISASCDLVAFINTTIFVASTTDKTKRTAGIIAMLILLTMLPLAVISASDTTSTFAFVYGIILAVVNGILTLTQLLSGKIRCILSLTMMVLYIICLANI